MYEIPGIIAFVVGLTVYLAPAIVAKVRRREDALTIFLINLLLGWTVIGWFAASVLARRSVADRRLPHVARRSRRKAARSTIVKLVNHTHDCQIFGRGSARARCMMLAS